MWKQRINRSWMHHCLKFTLNQMTYKRNKVSVSRHSLMCRRIKMMNYRKNRKKLSFFHFQICLIQLDKKQMIKCMKSLKTVKSVNNNHLSTYKYIEYPQIQYSIRWKSFRLLIYHRKFFMKWQSVKSVFCLKLMQLCRMTCAILLIRYRYIFRNNNC